jgi:ANTAR domain
VTLAQLSGPGGPGGLGGLGAEAAELLDLTGTGGQARSLSRLAELAAWQVPGCAGATATLWHDQELVTAAATDPDLAWLDELQAAAGEGPLADAVSTRSPVTCQDTLGEARWPAYAHAALGRGVRCSAHLIRDLTPAVLVLSLYGVRPRAFAGDPVAGAAGALAAFGGTMLANATAYGQARQVAAQLTDSVAARSVTDQAKGILMHALGCGADEALRRMRAESQRRHIKVTEVARQVVAAYSGG